MNDTAPARTWLRPWRTLEIISVVGLGVTFGLVFWGWSHAYGVLGSLSVFAGPFSGLLGGPFLLAGVVGGLLLRRPGAALGTEVLAAAVEALLGNHWGITTLVSGVLQGLGVELVLAVFAYRLFAWPVAMLAGMAAVVLEMFYEWNAWMADMTVAFRLQYGLWFLVSGAVVAGLGGWVMARGLAATGAVDGLAAGAEQADRSRV